MDCISRFLFLAERFDDELAAYDHEEVPVIGTLSMGEIANHGQEYLEFYNNTSVVAVLSEP